jgi:exopolysaccharide production protein ExoQ
VLRSTVARNVGRIATTAVPDVPVSAEPSPGRVERCMLIGIMLFLNSLMFLLTSQIIGREDDSTSSTAEIVWTCVYLYALVGLIVERKRAAVAFRMSWPIIVLVALALLSTLWSPQPDQTAKRACGLLGTTLIGYYIGCRFKLSDFMECLVISTCISAILSIVAIVVFPQIGVMQDEYAGAWSGVYGQKNNLASAMVVGIISAVLLAISSKGRRRWVYTAMTVLFVGLLFGSRSVTSLLAAGGVVALIPLMLLMRSKRSALHTGLAIFLSSGLVAIVVLALGINAQTIFDFLGRDSTLTGRTDVWQYVMSAIGDRPLFGWGYKTFWLPEGPVQQYITSEWFPYHAHNGFLEAALDIGIVGTSVFVVGWLVGMWNAVRLVLRSTATVTRWPLLMMIYYFLSLITEAGIAGYNTLVWVVFVAVFVYAIPPLKEKLPHSFAAWSMRL